MHNAHWHIKPLIREIMLSAAYQQASTVAANLPSNVGQAASLPSSVGLAANLPFDTAQAASLPLPGQASQAQLNERQAGSLPYERAAKLDPENRLLWHMPAKRLEAEVIRDSILAVSGRLDSVMGGPPILLVARPDGLVVVDESKLKRPADAEKRSVYLLSRRAYNLSLLTVFDRPLFAVNCPKRDSSVMPLQSLTMLNDQFVAEESAHFAARIATQSLPTDEVAVDRAFALALCRTPDDREVRRCTAYLNTQRDAFESAGETTHDATRHAFTELCHTLLNTSEFLYAE
jgi:hypothetical protein